MAESEQYVPIAKIGAPYGVIGEQNLILLATSMADALSYGQWFLLQDGQWQLLEGEKVFQKGQKFLIQLPFVNDRQQAKDYTHCLLGVPRDVLPDLPEDEYYWSDLIGLSVVNLQGESFGTVIDLLETGANQVLCCDNNQQEALIPFVKQHVVRVDFVNQTILVDWSGIDS